MTSVPKPLKFLRPHNDTLKKVYEKITDDKTKVDWCRVVHLNHFLPIVLLMQYDWLLLWCCYLSDFDAVHCGWRIHFTAKVFEQMNRKCSPQSSGTQCYNFRPLTPTLSPQTLRRLNHRCRYHLAITSKPSCEQAHRRNLDVWNNMLHGYSWQCLMIISFPAIAGLLLVMICHVNILHCLTMIQVLTWLIT